MNLTLLNHKLMRDTYKTGYFTIIYTGICSVLPGLADNHQLNRLRDWRAYRSLSDEEESALLRLCNLLDPDDLTGMTTLPQGRSKLHSSKEISGIVSL